MALERFGAEAVLPKDPILEIKQGDKTNNGELLSSTGSTPNSVDPHISDPSTSGSNTSDSGEQSSTGSPHVGKEFFAKMAGDAKFQQWKVEVAGKESVSGPPVAKKEFRTGGQAPSLKSHNDPLPEAKRAQDSVGTGTDSTTRRTALGSPTIKGKQTLSNSGSLLLYIRSREDNPMFSSSCTPSKHSSENPCLPGRWIKVNLGNYLDFELADNRFENVGKPRAWNPGETALGYLCPPKTGRYTEW